MRYYRLLIGSNDTHRDYFAIEDDSGVLFFVMRLCGAWTNPIRKPLLRYTDMEPITKLEAILRGLDDILPA